jgi:hypothetical protein
VKNLKSTRAAPAVSPNEMLRIAGAAAPKLPSAVVSTHGSDKSAMLSVRMTEATLEALAGHALEHGTTQRRVIAEALAARGIIVSARDLEDRPQPRRRGGRTGANRPDG